MAPDSQTKLSEGALQVIMGGGTVTKPIVQILGSKKINSAGSEKERYRLLLSDGKYSISHAMIATSGSNISDSDLAEWGILQLNSYIVNVITNAKGNTPVLVLMDVVPIKSGDQVGARIGSPTLLGAEPSRQSSSVTAAPALSSTSEMAGSSNSIKLNVSSSSERIISPIMSLSPYHNKWIIRARVTNKTDIRKWSNSRGEGQLFSLDLLDESGEIRCTAFRDLVDKYYNYVQVDKVYYISKCQLKPTNRQFCTLKCDYEMTLTNESTIEECVDADTGIPQVSFNFVPIESIAQMDVNTTIDVIGICKSSSELLEFTSKNTKRDLKKRDVTLLDQSGTAVCLTLWGQQAETFDGSGNPVVVIKNARIGEFNNAKSLSTIANSQLKINPDLPEAFRLKGWYDQEGKDVEVTNISARSGSAGNFNTPWLTLGEVQNQGLGKSSPSGDYFQVQATVLLARSENSVYKACPTEECNKKIIDLENGMYRCEKCNRDFPHFKYRLLLSMNIGDATSSQWVTMFASEAEKVLGKTSQEVGEAFANDSDAAARIFENANFQQFVFKCRAKMETYNDESRLKIVVIKVDPMTSRGDYNAYLIERIQKMLTA